MRSPLRYLLALLASAAPAALSSEAQAQAVTDGTAGAATSLPGPDFVVPHTLGTTSGTNLFHSFTSFDVPTGGSATFTGPAGYDNVISRVTGGATSTIDGLLISDVAGADFYFINPAGVVFGENAYVYVPAGFHVSTADSLGFANAAVLLASTSPGSTFSSAAPADFGFLGARIGDIDINASLVFAGPGLVEFVADSLTLDQAATIYIGMVNASDVQTAAPPDLVMDGTTITLDGYVASQTRDEAGGDLTFFADTLFVNGSGIGIITQSYGAGRSGDVNILADTATLTTSVQTYAYNVGDGGDVAITAATLNIGELNSIGSGIVTQSAPRTVATPAQIFQPGAGGNITVNAADLRLINGSIITSSTPVRLSGGQVLDIRESLMGTSGDLSINADRMVLRQSSIGTSSAATTYVSAIGPVQAFFGDGFDLSAVQQPSDLPTFAAPGDIVINAAEYLRLIEGSSIRSEGFVSDSGSIEINAPELTVRGGAFEETLMLYDPEVGGLVPTTYAFQQPSIISTSVYDVGDGGAITIVTDDLQLLDGGRIESTTGISPPRTENGFSQPNLFPFAAGAGGIIDITAQTVTIAGGIVPSQTVLAGTGENDYGPFAASGLFATSFAGGGTGGSIVLNAGDVGISSGGELNATALADGDGGQVFVHADTLALSYAIITAQTVGAGAGGPVLIEATTSVETNAGLIFANTTGPGSAGSLSITAPSLNILNGSFVETNTFGDGEGGNLSLLGDVVLIEDSLVSSGSLAAGDSGDMTISVTTLLDLVRSNLLVGTNETGDAGEVRLSAPTINVTNTYITAGTMQGGAGGSIFITGDNMSVFGLAPDLGDLVEGPTISGGVSATAWGSGQGGNITIDLAGSLFIGDGAAISTGASGTGSSGDINITASVVEAVKSPPATSDELPKIAILSETAGEGDAGTIRIDALSLVLDQARITADTVGAGRGGSVLIDATQTELLNDSVIASRVWADGPGGLVRISGATLDIIGGGGIVVDTSGTGAGGNAEIAVDALYLDLESKGGFGISTSTTGLGNAGNVTIDAGLIDIVNGNVTSQAEGDGSGLSGNAGAIVGNFDLLRLGAGEISSSTSASGDAGAVTLTGRRVEMTGALGASIRTESIGGETAGKAGPITISLTEALVVEGGNILSGTQGAGNAGAINITAPSIELRHASQIDSGTTLGSGDSGSVTISGDALVLDEMSSITTTTEEGGAAGAITINVGAIQLLAGSVITSNAEVPPGSPGTSGAAGDIHIAANSLIISGYAATGAELIHSNIGAFAGPGAGKAGNVAIVADSVQLLDGGTITAFSNNQFDGGVVTIEAQTVEVRGAAPDIYAGLPAGFGMYISTPDIGLNSAFITDTFATGAAGTIIVRAQNISFVDGGMARTNTSSSGRGGTIIICPDGTLLIAGEGSALVANSSAGSTGNAGTIGVRADEVVLEDGGRITVASAGSGRGGQVIVQAHIFNMTNAGGAGPATAINTLVSGAAGAGSLEGAGQVAILAGEMNVVGGSVVTTDTTGSAPAGRIVIRAGELNLEGADTLVSSASTSSNRGNAGVIDIAARNLTIDGARISTLSQTGSGGQVILAVDEQLILNQGEITTQVRGSTSDSNAGDILIGLRPSTLSFTDPCEGVCAPFDPFSLVPAPNPSDGIPDVLVNEGGRIVGSAEVGRGGAVVIVADSIVNNGLIQSDPDSGIDVSSVSGIDGTTSVTGAEFVLPNFVIAPDTDFRSMCEAQQRGLESNFTEALGVRPFDPTTPSFTPYGEDNEQVAEAETLATCSAEARASTETRERRRWFRLRGGAN